MRKFTLFLITVLAMLSASAQPYLVGHRGSRWGVENTEEAFINGAKKGYHYLETDVKVTSDGKYVCCHNDDLTSWGGTLTIYGNTLANLQKQKLTQTRGGVTYTGYLTTFERYLDICKEYGVKPVIELKYATGITYSDQSKIPGLIKIIEEKGFRNDCYIFTSMKECLVYIKENYPDIEIMHLCYEENFDIRLDWCKQYDCHIGSEYGSTITKAGIQKYHDAGLLVNIWTTNDYDIYEKYGNMGADFITTDYLDPAQLPTLSTPTTMLGAIKTGKSDITLTAGVGETVYTDITVSGSNMGSTLTVTSSNNAFTVTNNTSLSSGTISGSIRVSFRPTAEGVTTGTITLKGTTKSGNEVTTKINVTGKCSLKFEEVWNYSETSGKAPATGINWASDKAAIRNIAYGNGKLYTIYPSSSTISVINAQTGEKIKDLDMTGISGGTFGVMDAEVVNGKLVACNLSTASALLAKAYVWDTDDSAPREILNSTDLGGCTRLGDCFDVEGDLNSGALLFLSGSNIVKYNITNGTVSETPTVIPVTKNGAALDAGTSPRVIAQGDGKYWITGRAIYPSLVSSSGTVELTLDSDVLNGVIDGNDFYPFTFKGKQYAFATTYAAGSSTLTACRAVLIDASNGWGNAINVGEYPADGLGATRNTNLSTGIEIDVNGTEGVEMWINCNNQGIAHYRYGAAKVHTSDPTLSVSQNSLAFETTENNVVTKDIAVSGVNLTDNITLSISGASASQFSISPSSISPLNGVVNANVTITYSPTVYSVNHSATLTISSTGALSKTVIITGKNEETPEISGFSLSQQWSQTSGHLTANTNTRWATAFGEKIYINDHANSKLYYWSKDGLKDTGISTAAGTAITSDDAGNIIISTSMWSTGSTAYKVLPSGSTTLQDLTITLPDTMTANQMQYMGKAIGNILSADGGAMYIYPKNTCPAKIIVKNGAYSSGVMLNDGDLVADAQSIAVPLTSDINSNSIAARVRGSRYFYVYNNSAFTTQEHANVNTTAGGTYFTLQDILFAVEPIGTAYCDGFQIVNTTTGEIVATHAAQFTTAAVAPNANCLVAEIVDEWNARIYQYVPGQLAAQYLFEIKHSSGVEDIAVSKEAEMSINKNGSTLAVAGIDAQAIAIYSMNGSLVRMVNNANEVDVDGLNGMYIVTVTDAQGVVRTEKVVIK